MEAPTVPLPHTITVRAYQGTGPYGERFGEPATRHALVEDRRRLVVTAGGEEVISETTAYTDLDALVPVGSQVTVWRGTPHERIARVITTSRYEHPASWSHVEIALT